MGNFIRGILRAMYKQAIKLFNKRAPKVTKKLSATVRARATRVVDKYEAVFEDMAEIAVDEAIDKFIDELTAAGVSYSVARNFVKPSKGALLQMIENKVTGECVEHLQDKIDDGEVTQEAEAGRAVEDYISDELEDLINDAVKDALESLYRDYEDNDQLLYS